MLSEVPSKNKRKVEPLASPLLCIGWVSQLMPGLALGLLNKVFDLLASSYVRRIPQVRTARWSIIPDV